MSAIVERKDFSNRVRLEHCADDRALRGRRSGVASARPCTTHEHAKTERS